MASALKLAAVLALACASASGRSAPSSAPSSSSSPASSPPSASAPQNNTSPQATSSESEDTPKDASPGTSPAAVAPNPGDSTKLEPISTEKAAYPYEAREKQLQGQVLLKLSVSETGDVQNAEVISGDPVLAKSAVTAAKKWKFKPFIRNGKAVAVHATIPFNFAFSENVHETQPPTENSSATGETPKRVRVSAGVTTGMLIHKVQPVYPEQARWARIQGTVILAAVIDKEGQIADLRLISGPKELVPAAIGAVQQWRYKPYHLLGQPVEVDTEIHVNFQLH